MRLSCAISKESDVFLEISQTQNMTNLSALASTSNSYC